MDPMRKLLVPTFEWEGVVGIKSQNKTNLSPPFLFPLPLLFACRFLPVLQTCACPTTVGGVQNGISVWNVLHVAHACLRRRLEPTCMLGRCLLTKISASELSRKFKLRVRCWLGSNDHAVVVRTVEGNPTHLQ